MKVSIIIPVYNVAPFIEDCLNSVMKQTYTGNMECLLVDDCGTDDSISIAESMIEAYGGPIRFEVIYHDHNRGLSAARNTGTQNATGDYIYYLDSDDEITEDCIERLMAQVEEHPGVELVQGNVKTLPIFNWEGLTVRVRVPVTLSNEEVRSSFFVKEQMNVAAWNKLVKRSFLVEHNIEFIEGVIYEDTPWVFMLLKYLSQCCFVPEITYYYKRRDNSIVTGSNNYKKAYNLRRIYHQILSDLTPGNEAEEIKYYGKKMAYLCARYAKVVPEYMSDIECWQILARKYGPSGVRLRLAFGKRMGRTKYGWLILSLLYRFEHPRVFYTDVQRILKVIR